MTVAEAADRRALAATAMGRSVCTARAQTAVPEAVDIGAPPAEVAAAAVTMEAVEAAEAGGLMVITLAAAAVEAAARRTSSQAPENMRAGKVGKRRRATVSPSLAGSGNENLNSLLSRA